MLTINDLSRNEALSSHCMGAVVGGAAVEEAAEGVEVGGIGPMPSVAQAAMAYNDKIVSIPGFFGSLLGVL
jgi:hypothetical protein